MADEGHEFIGKTVEEATEEGLAQLGLQASQAHVEIISRGSRGIFGIGSEPARVRITRRAADGTTVPAVPPQPPEPLPQARDTTPAPAPSPSAASAPPPVAQPETTAVRSDAQPSGRQNEVAPGIDASGTADHEVAERTSDDQEEETRHSPGENAIPIDEDELADLSREMLMQLVVKMGFQCDIEADWREPADDESERYLHLDITGNDLGALIGRRGETLASLQYLVRLMVNQRIRQWKPIVVDVENYKERRNNQLTQLALRMAEQVSQSGRAMSLEPMPANERRIIHLTLRDHPEVYTQSSGEGERRKVHIVVKE